MNLQEHLEGRSASPDVCSTRSGSRLLVDNSKVEIGGKHRHRLLPRRCHRCWEPAACGRYRDVSAKQGGKCTFRFFDQSMDDEMRAQEAYRKGPD